MKHILFAAVLGVATTLAAVAASASTFVYGLADHPRGGLAGAPRYENYGLRLDTNPDGGNWTDRSGNVTQRFFSFGNGGTVTSDFTAFLFIDTIKQTARIYGTMVESFGVDPFGNDVFGDKYTVDYMMTGIQLDPAGNTNGFFSERNGTGGGTIFDADESINLYNAKRSKTGEYFNFDGGVRGYIGGEGWVGGVPANDFLFTGTLITSNPPNNPPAVPLPAAGWMLLAGVGALAATRRRRKEKA